MNIYSRSSAKVLQKQQKVVPRKRRAAGGRAEIIAGDVNEDRASEPSDARPGVVIDFDNQIVEPVRAQKPVAWFIGRAPKRPVVAPIHWILAPSVVRHDSPRR
jgi:hypothetical protein